MLLVKEYHKGVELLKNLLMLMTSSFKRYSNHL